MPRTAEELGPPLADDDILVAQRATLTDAVIADAVDYWNTFAAEPYKGLIETDQGWTWDATALLYRNAKNHLLSRLNLRAKLDAVIDEELQADFVEDSNELIGEGDDQEQEEDDDDAVPLLLVSWQSEMEHGILKGIALGALLAAGGVSNFLAEQRTLAQERAFDQFKWLGSFATEIVSGEQAIDLTLPSRAGMYAGSSVSSHEAIYRSIAVEVFQEERRYIMSDHPCDPCTGYAGLGWQPIGTLPGIAEDCDCRSRCRCVFEYRLRRRPIF